MFSVHQRRTRTGGCGQNQFLILGCIDEVIAGSFAIGLLNLNLTLGDDLIQLTAGLSASRLQQDLDGIGIHGGFR
jgi:hypothetical protein